MSRIKFVFVTILIRKITKMIRDSNTKENRSISKLHFLIQLATI